MKRPEGFDKLIIRASTEKDADKRVALTQQLVKLAYDEAMFIPFFAEGARSLVSLQVRPGYTGQAELLRPITFNLALRLIKTSKQIKPIKPIKRLSIATIHLI
jgi:hypothetical protein